jgi:hypothetical protein
MLHREETFSLKSKIAFNLSLDLHEEVQATGEAFSPQ